MSLVPRCGDFVADVDLAALELDDAILQGEDRVIFAQADVEAGVVLCATLTNDDPARRNERAAVDFDPAILRVAVAAVAGGTLTLLMCHKSPVILTKIAPCRSSARAWESIRKPRAWQVERRVMIGRRKG